MNAARARLFRKRNRMTVIPRKVPQRVQNHCDWRHAAVMKRRIAGFVFTFEGLSSEGEQVMRSMSATIALAMLAAGAIATASRADDLASLEQDTGQVHIGTGVICDTQDEVTNFVRSMGEHDPGGALQKVNRESQNPMACGMATVAFHAGKKLGEIRTTKGSFNIVEIEIVAGSVNGEWRMVPHRTQFTAVAVAGYDI
jgi:hypothetical protein